MGGTGLGEGEGLLGIACSCASSASSGCPETAETELYQDDAVFIGNGPLQGGKGRGYSTANFAIVIFSGPHSDLGGTAERWKAGVVGVSLLQRMPRPICGHRR